MVREAKCDILYPWDDCLMGVFRLPPFVLIQEGIKVDI